MSGPIVRRYGFPNFEKIFGERPIEHGAEELESSDPPPAQKAPEATKPRTPAKPAAVQDESRQG
jgi:hypothetical protein